MSTYGYNLPWSGRLGRVHHRCIYCGTSGRHFTMSSHAERCGDPVCRERRHRGIGPIPRLVEAGQREYERLARSWCDERGIDFDATVAKHEDVLGPQNQERDGPIPGAGEAYETGTLIVYKQSEEALPTPIQLADTGE